MNHDSPFTIQVCSWGLISDDEIGFYRSVES